MLPEDGRQSAREHLLTEEVDVPARFDKPSGMRDLEWQQLETNDEEADGVVRLVLLGELDIAVTAELEAHLRQVAGAGRRIRLDLSRLSFMDVCGLRAVIRSVNAARRDGWQLEIDRDVSACVRRLIDLVGAGREVWPEAAEHRRRRGRGRSQPQRAAEAASA
jgi:anti-anti-sigma factor